MKLLIGDALRDLEAATFAGVPIRILVETGYGREMKGGKNAPHIDRKLDLVDGGKRNAEWTIDGDNAKPSILPFLFANNLRLHDIESPERSVEPL